MKFTIPNPTRPGALKPVEVISDRAKRYRAVRNCEQTDRVCIYCGRPEGKRAGALMVDHIDGHEAHGESENLALACRSCNTAKGAFQARENKGKRTVQYNPRRSSEARPLTSWKQFVAAISAVKGLPSTWSYDTALARLRAMDPDLRSRLAREANTQRWGEVPF